MNVVDYVLLFVIVLLMILVIRYMLKHKGGCGDCGGCQRECHRPPLYEAYRKDHPFEEDKQSMVGVE